MWCLTAEASRDWCNGRGFELNERGTPLLPNLKHAVQAPLSELNWSRLHPLAGLFAHNVGPFDECLLWVTQWGVWPSSENLHLFYRLRGSYGEQHRLADAPGHLFAKHEAADLSTFVQLALACGWDFYLLPAPTYAAGFVSHDEFMVFHTDRSEAVESIKAALPGTEVRPDAE